MHSERRGCYRVRLEDLESFRASWRTCRGDRIEGAVRDLSIANAGIELRPGCEPGCTIGETLRLELSSERLSFKVEVQAALQSIDRAGQAWRMGFVFSDRDEVERLIPPAFFRLWNRRQDYRIGPSPEQPIDVVLRVASEEDIAPPSIPPGVSFGEKAIYLECTMKDISPSGIGVLAGLELERFLSQAERVELSFCLPTSERTLRFTARLRGRRLESGRIACGFVFERGSTPLFERQRREIRDYILHRQCEIMDMISTPPSMADQAPALIWMSGPDRKCTYFNRSWLRFTGLSLDEELGNGWTRAIHPDDLERLLCKRSDAYEERREFQAEYRLLHRDGEHRWVIESCLPRFTPDGKLIGLIGSCIDISEQKAIEDLLTEATVAAEASDLAKSEFLAKMSHELRTPMTAIMGFTEELRYLAEQSAVSPEFREGLSIIEMNSHHLLNLIDGILDLSKISARKTEFNYMDCSPHGLVQEIEALMSIHASAKGLALVIDHDGELPERVHVDPLRLKQILINLVGNAIKFTDEGEIRLRTRLSGEEMRGMVEFDVIDSGMGLTEQDARQLFRPFARGSASRSRAITGTGLGLAISRELARMMGGDLRVVETRPGKGTTFRLAIPVGLAELPPLVGPPQEHSVLAGGGGEADPEPHELECRILIAEDNPVNRMLIARILEHHGADVELVVNGREACERALQAQAEGDPFDVVIMDMQMPVLDGYEATRELRARGYEGPIIALTASAMVGDRERCLEAGCTDYTSKPISRSDLLRALTQSAE